MIFNREPRLLPFWQNASAATPEGTSSPENAPLIATVRIIGNLRRTTDSNSKPDIPGILRSDKRISGTPPWCISANAENPWPALRTPYPISVSTWEREIRIEDSSSTMSRLPFALSMSRPRQVVLHPGVGASVPFRRITMLFNFGQDRQEIIWCLRVTFLLSPICPVFRHSLLAPGRAESH